MKDPLGGEALERFSDRHDAGRQLADALEEKISGEDSVILALPRGGVPVAYEVATRIGAPLDIVFVRKLGVPWQPELAFGAIGTGDVVVLNRDHLKALGVRLPSGTSSRGRSPAGSISWKTHHRRQYAAHFREPHGVHRFPLGAP